MLKGLRPSIAFYISFYQQLLGLAMAFEIDFNGFGERAQVIGVVFYMYSTNRIGRDCDICPVGAGAAAGSAHVVDVQRLGACVVKSEGMCDGLAVSNVAKVVGGCVPDDGQLGGGGQQCQQGGG